MSRFERIKTQNMARRTPKTKAQWEHDYVYERAGEWMTAILFAAVFGLILGAGIGMLFLNALQIIGLSLLSGLFWAVAGGIIYGRMIQLECNKEMKKMTFEASDVLAESKGE